MKQFIDVLLLFIILSQSAGCNCEIASRLQHIPNNSLISSHKLTLQVSESYLKHKLELYKTIGRII